MTRKLLSGWAVALAGWLPFFAIWLLFALSYAREPFFVVLISSLISMGTAGLLGLPVWRIAEQIPWPLGFRLNFYLLQLSFAAVYGATWSAMTMILELGMQRAGILNTSWSWTGFGRRLLMGIWFYAIFAGISYTVKTRSRLHEKETLAARAAALATAARLDALRARLNPHFLFNALHTLSALVRFRPQLAEGAVERLGDMLRYTLKEDGRGLVEFSEEYDFTRQYLSFEQLRYEDRLNVELQIDPESFNFDIPPFSIQTLAENAVHHAISVRTEGGSIWIKSSCQGGRLTVSVRDDGPGSSSDSAASHQFGLRALRERLQAAYGVSAELTVHSNAKGFEAILIFPSSAESNLKEENENSEHS